MYHPEGSRVASLFYDTLLDQHEYWEKTFEHEGIMKLQLPHRDDTDGASISIAHFQHVLFTFWAEVPLLQIAGQLLVHQAKHSIARSMITRRVTWFPKCLPRGIYHISYQSIDLPCFWVHL